MASDSSGFKSLTDAYDTLKTFAEDHFVTVDKPEETTNQSSKSIAMELGFSANIGMTSQVAEAFSIYSEGPLALGSVSALAMKSTTSLICTASTNLNAAMEWGDTDFGLTGVAVKTTLSDKSATTAKTAVTGIASALVVTFQKASAAATKIPGIDIAG